MDLFATRIGGKSSHLHQCRSSCVNAQASESEDDDEASDEYVPSGLEEAVVIQP